MGIHKGLRYLFSESERGYAWMKKRNRAFGGRTPVEVMAQDDIFSLARMPRLPRRGARRLVTADIPLARMRWQKAYRIIRSIHPPIDLFEDIADPQD